jgi:serine/threonine protein kinase
MGSKGTPLRFSISSQHLRPGALQCPACGELFPDDFRVCPRDAVELVEAVEEAQNDSLLGGVLNDSYQILRQVGEGGMGRVYEARHVRLMNRTYAIKIMHVFHTRHPEVVERFRQEAETTCTIAHENVVEVYDLDSTPDGVPYMVCEFLDGEDLGAVLERVGSLDESSSARIIRQVCRALHAAHQHGVIHRDMKPENVYVLGDLNAPRVKLLDFGIARVEDPAKAMHTRTGLIMGTPAYMAPEQARGIKVDRRADVYSVGAILYRMVTGKCAHEKEDAAQTLHSLLTEEPVRPCELAPRLSAAFELVIQRAMAREPADRYETMLDLEAELAAFDEGREAVPDDGADPTGESAPLMIASAEGPGAVHRAARSLVARASRQSKTARPWIVMSLMLIVLWTYGVLTRSILQSVELVTGEAASQTTLFIILVAVGVAMVTPVVMWIRTIARTVWRNSINAITTARRLRAFAVGAFATLGLGVLALALMTRFASVDHLQRIIDLSLAGASFLIGLLAYSLTPREH